MRPLYDTPTPEQSDAICDGWPGVTTSLDLFGNPGTFSHWTYPVVFVLAYNAAHAYQGRSETARGWSESDVDQFLASLGWGFVAMLIGLPLLVTYRGLGGEAVSPDVAWLVLFGIAVTFTLWAGDELRERWS